MQHIVAGGEHHGVLVGSAGHVLGTEHRNHTAGSQEPRLESVPKQPAVSNEMQHAPGTQAKQKRVGDRVRMIRRKNDRTRGRDMIPTRNLKLAEVAVHADVHEETGDAIQKGFVHKTPGFGFRWSEYSPAAPTCPPTGETVDVFLRQIGLGFH